jgi:hypothetical protein
MDILTFIVDKCIDPFKAPSEQEMDRVLSKQFFKDAVVGDAMARRGSRDYFTCRKGVVLLCFLLSKLFPFAFLHFSACPQARDFQFFPSPLYDFSSFNQFKH